MYYVYKTTNTVNNKIYIGVHKSDNIQSDQYLGSGKHLNSAVVKYGRDKFKRQILYQFKSKEQAYLMQSQIVDKQFVKRKDTYNFKLGGQGGWNHLRGTVCVKDQNGNFARISKNDERWVKRELHGHTYGMISAKDKDGNCFQVEKNDLRWLNGQLVGVGIGNIGLSGKVVAKSKDGNRIVVNKNDYRLLNGELDYNTSGIVTCKDTEGNVLRMSKEQFDYLKKQGTVYGIAKGIKRDKCSCSGTKNSQYGTMWITNGSQNKKIKKSELIPQGWKKGRICKVV